MKDQTLLMEVETFLESLDGLEPDVDISCVHCEEPLKLWVGDICGELNDRRLVILEKVRARLYREAKQ